MCNLKKIEHLETESRLVITRGGGVWVREMSEVGQKYKLAVIRLINSRRVMHAIVTTVNNTMLYI